jgi:hypothetical protein
MEAWETTESALTSLALRAAAIAGINVKDNLGLVTLMLNTKACEATTKSIKRVQQKSLSLFHLFEF